MNAKISSWKFSIGVSPAGMTADPSNNQIQQPSILHREILEELLQHWCIPYFIIG